jgi:transcriptional regulator with PAS, ATPase and Fis domain
MSERKVLTLRNIIWLAILDALERNDGNRNKAARELGISRTTLFRWMRGMNVPSKSPKKSS